MMWLCAQGKGGVVRATMRPNSSGHISMPESILRFPCTYLYICVPYVGRRLGSARLLHSLWICFDDDDDALRSGSALIFICSKFQVESPIRHRTMKIIIFFLAVLGRPYQFFSALILRGKNGNNHIGVGNWLYSNEWRLNL